MLSYARLSLPGMGALSVATSLALTTVSAAHAVTSSPSVPSSMGGNGHNISFDGRLVVVRDHQGWQAQLLRPEAVTYLASGLPDASGAMWSPRMHLAGSPGSIENALALCEADPVQAPFSCNEQGQPGGNYDCYDLWVIDSDAVTPAADGGFVMRRRALKVWVAQPKTAQAALHKFEWGPIEPLSPTIMGIEPTVTADGRLLVYQGHPANDGTIDILMYTTASSACAASGWSAPRSLSDMYADPNVVGTYALAERQLRAADGTPFQEGDLFRGAYPWLMPAGDAVMFAATTMPCISTENPPGCGPRRNALSVVGYPTNWGVAHIDGGVNPDTNQTVRLFFSSPGPTTFSQLPVTPGLDVWPFIGSNTANYVELSFDDGLDGNYAGLWHFNESISHDAEMDKTRTPDASGYFNTGQLMGGLSFSPVNDGVVGKGLTFDGIDDRVEVPSAQSLNPVNGLTISFYIRPDQSPDCDDENNYRLLLSKGGIGDGAYSVVLEESLALQARVNVDGEMQSIASPPLPLGQWTHVSVEYDGLTGQAGIFYDDANVVETSLPAGTIVPASASITIGAPGPRDACPAGDGAFAGALDEVAISRYARHYGEPEQPPGPVGGGGGPGEGGAAGVGGMGAGANAGGTGAGLGGSASGVDAEDEGDDGGCGCGVPTQNERRGRVFLVLGLAALAWRRPRRA